MRRNNCESELSDSQKKIMKKEFLAGVKNAIPFMVASMPTGIIIGTLAIANGFSVGEGLLLSCVINSGSAQMIGMQLLKQGAGLFVILMTTFLLGLRLLIYSSVIAKKIERFSPIKKFLMAFGLIDAVFFMVTNKYKDNDSRFDKNLGAYYAGAAIALYINWIASTAIGLFIGEIIPDFSSLGLDFINIAAFIAMLAECFADWKLVVTMSVSSLVVIFAINLPYNLGIVVAGLAGAIAGNLCDSLFPDEKDKIDDQIILDNTAEDELELEE